MMPSFTDPAARQRWNTYFAEVDRLVSRAGNAAEGLEADLREHLADSFSAHQEGSETERLDAAIAQLGNPQDYLRPLLADHLLDRASHSYSPLTLGRGLYHAILSGSRRAAVALAFALGYVLLAVFAAMVVLKPYFANRVGLIRGNDGSLIFGISDQAGSDLLGAWTIPVSLAGCLIVYLLLTRALRARRKDR